jgi:hypothetical protein
LKSIAKTNPKTSNLSQITQPQSKKGKHIESHSPSNPNNIHQTKTITNNNTPPTPQSFNIPSIINKILHHHQDPIQPTPWTFKQTQEAATKNSMLLHSLNFDVEKATQHPRNTILSYGSEFRPTNIIKPLLQYHPQWTEVELIINNGANYPLRPITEQDRLDDIQYMINRGNHQSTKPTENQAALDKAFDKEVKAHWAIPLNPAVINMIPGASITPLGVATQWTVNPQNERIKKR